MNNLSKRTYLVFNNRQTRSSRYISLSFKTLQAIFTNNLDLESIPNLPERLSSVELKWLQDWLQQVYLGKANYGICKL